MKKINKLDFFQSKIYNIIYLILCVFSFISILIIQILKQTDFNNQSYQLGIRIIVPLFVFVSFLYSLITNKIKQTFLVSIALFCCFIAELLGSLKVDMNLIAFVFCHISLIIYFLQKTHGFHKKDFLFLIPFFIILIIYNLVCFLWWIPIHNNVGIIFKLAVPIYGALLTFVVWRALCTYKKDQWLLFFLGTLIFYLSDLNVVLEGIAGFGITDPIALFTFTWVTYPIAISLLSMFGRNTLHVFLH